MAPPSFCMTVKIPQPAQSWPTVAIGGPRCNDDGRMNQGPGPFSPMPLTPPSLPMAGDAPYRTPTATPVPATPLRSTTRWVYLSLVVLSCVGFCVAAGIWTYAALSVDGAHARPNETLFVIGTVTFGLTVLVVYAHLFVGLYWVYKAWEWLPPEQRYTKHWRSWISPTTAALLLLVPYFHYYWMFVVSCGLCDAFDRMRVSHPTRDAAPKGLAIAACIAQIVAPVPVGAIMWLVLMTKFERLSREMSASPRAA